jgi:aspartyl/asparaginyl beta-hydroxylase (cupin superfamily)
MSAAPAAIIERPLSQKMRDELEALVAAATWKIVPGRAYQTAHVLKDLRETKNLFERWHDAFLLKLPPEGRLHRHTDTLERYLSYHVVIATNQRAFNCFERDGKPISLHLEQWGVYRFDRSVPHWAVNGGRTDRIHLICEVYDDLV